MLYSDDDVLRQCTQAGKMRCSGVELRYQSDSLFGLLLLVLRCEAFAASRPS